MLENFWLFLSACIILITAQIPPPFVHFVHDYEDDDRSHWQGLCRTGKRQSPINIMNPKNHQFCKLSFINYDQRGNITLNTTWHEEMGLKSVVISGFEDWPRAPFIQGGGFNSDYRLHQFHVHWSFPGSEHAMNGHFFAAEIHLLHVKGNLSFEEAKQKEDGLAVVAVFMTEGSEGKPLQSLERIFSRVVLRANKMDVDNFNLNALIPKDTNAWYRYNGSQTFPPCEESIIWTVMSEPVEITTNQLGMLQKLRDGNGRSMINGRPIQNSYGRTIYYNTGDDKSKCGK